MRLNQLKAPLFALVVAALAAGAMAEDLKPGMPAPALKVAGWVKGEEVKKFEKGKIYVVEFWATWCGPCKTSIPHLTEMAKANRDVTFIGVDSFEQPADNLDAVKKFVADMGDKMDYRVAVDGSAALMAKNWMVAAKQKGIPTAFIVDKDTNIAWIGHPMEMEEPLKQIVAGTYDLKGESAKADAANKKEARMQELMEQMQDDIQKGDTKSAITRFDTLFTEFPEMEKQLGPTKFQMMAQVGDKAANDYAKKLYDSVLGDDAVGLNQVAWWMVDDETGFKAADLDLGLKITLKSNELTKFSDPSLMDTLGYTYFKLKKIDKAIEIQEKAVKLAEADKNVPEDTRDELRGRLAKFKKAKKSGV